MMKDLPASERPRERFLNDGAGSLSNAELLAILIQSGTKEKSALSLAQVILNQTDGLKNLNEITPEELMSIPGIGKSKSVLLLAGIEFGKRIAYARQKKEKAILTPSDAFSCLCPQMRHLSQEHFIVLFLDTKNQVIGKKTIAIGSLNRAIVHPREVFKEAIKRSCASIVCAHNHPSGDASPSAQDIQLTRRLEEVGELIGIKLVDHLIVGESGFISLKERGYLE